MQSLGTIKQHGAVIPSRLQRGICFYSVPIANCYLLIAEIKMENNANTDLTCSETGRRFNTAKDARASEERFRFVQAECDAGRFPDLSKGDVIYVETELYLGHGVDDWRGGLIEVIDFNMQVSGGKPRPYACVLMQTHSWHNWQMLAAKQKELRAECGKRWAHAIPDHRPEFNKWW